MLIVAEVRAGELIHDLGRAVLRTALDQAARWQALHPGPEVAVDVSPAQLQRPGFAEEVAGLLAQTRVRAGDLCLEVTEGVLLEPHGTSSANLRALHESGVRLAVDDALILRAVADLGRARQCQVLAEGVETPEQRRVLAELGYRQAQGFLWSRPAGAAAITDLLRSAGVTTGSA
ncbi:EAL domain-containing protein (putative c-di-GMP-specific phosphodiesterase class I) [Kineococcus xinjiangensis]|uniref:EAL domain-containing protein (Putative c-di-GMP-specific phosphodiesterase class I) n=1 Tax=Kineococcus xinjiangensis TaxID=512762 RepID=A0A2S6IJA8_9ACTN|nr:EAL domain-containing protein [Kineococcus xinjiangensis]PPK94240.1 EAL domain-containing protein (putative c-di-GMP-specific phosphodiesterase class I) [Kineococcus xinjiangensis]